MYALWSFLEGGSQGLLFLIYSQKALYSVRLSLGLPLGILADIKGVPVRH